MPRPPTRLPTLEETSSSAGDLLANWPFVISVLYLCSYFTGISAIIGVVLAHVFVTRENEEWEHTQYLYLIRTFWTLIGSWMVALIGGIVIGIQTEPVAGLALGVLFAIVALVVSSVRTINSMIYAVRQKPMPRPRTLLI